MDKFLLLRVGWWRTDIGSKTIHPRPTKGLNCSAKPHLAYIPMSEARGFTLSFGKPSGGGWWYTYRSRQWAVRVSGPFALVGRSR